MTRTPTLFEIAGLERALTPKERRRLRRSPAPAGHAAPPGTGPRGQTCGTCCHLVRKQYARAYLKCGLARSRWTSGSATDVRAGDPACRLWEAKP